MLGNTIIAAPFEGHAHLKALVIEDIESESAILPELDDGRRLFKIRAANSEGYRSSASILVSRRYAWRGYRTGGDSAIQLDENERITLVAVSHDETIGTITIGFDGSDGLYVDDLFPREVAALRAEGKTICEFTRLAIDSGANSKRVLASLFHVAYIYAHRLMEFDSLLIEVNPRHVRYYEKMLGFRAVGPERLNRRVNAPAVLMCLDFTYAHAQITRFGSGQRAHHSDSERSLYPYCLSVEEEAGIVGRLRGMR